jgi:hypothetical protein
MFGEAWAQSPDQPQLQKSDRAEQNSKAKERGSEESPFIIKILPAEQSEKKTTTNTNEGPKQRSDRWLEGWNLSDKIAAIASVAATLQFVALVAILWITIRNGRRQPRAYLFPNDASIYEGMMMTPPLPAHTNEPGVVLNFKNSGQTPAYKIISWQE